MLKLNSNNTFIPSDNPDLSRNYLVLLLHGMLGQTGFRLINAPTFMPAYLLLLSGSELLVGAALAGQHFMAALSSIPTGNLVAHRERVKPMLFGVGLLMRLQVLGIVLAGLFFSNAITLVATCIFLMLFGFFNGMQAVAFIYVMSKVIPVSVRGRLTGFRNLLAGLVSTFVAYFGGSYFIENEVWGNGYAMTFLVAFMLTMFGLFVMLLLREPQYTNMPEPSSLSGRVRGFPKLLREDPDFTWFLVARSLAALAMAAVPFYILYIGKQSQLSGSALGIITMSFILSQTISNFFWGFLADHRGNRLAFALAVMVWLMASIALLVAPPQLWVFCIVYTGLGCGLAGFQIAGQNLVLEYGKKEDIAMRIGLANSLNSFAFALGPLLGGILVTLTSYTTLFILSIGFKLCALLATWLFVREPRHTH